MMPKLYAKPTCKNRKTNCKPYIFVFIEKLHNLPVEYNIIILYYIYYNM